MSEAHCRRYLSSSEEDLSGGGGRREGLRRFDDPIFGACAAEVSPTGTSASSCAGGKVSSPTQTECTKRSKTSRSRDMGSLLEGGKNQPSTDDDEGWWRGLGKALWGLGQRKEAAAFAKEKCGSSGGGCNQPAACSGGTGIAGGQSLEREMVELWWLTGKGSFRF